MLIWALPGTLARHIRTLTRRRTDRRPRHVTRHGHLLYLIPGLRSLLVHSCCQRAWRLSRCHRPPGGDLFRAVTDRGFGDLVGAPAMLVQFPSHRCLLGNRLRSASRYRSAGPEILMPNGQCYSRASLPAAPVLPGHYSAGPSVLKVAPRGGRTWPGLVRGLEGVSPGDRWSSSVAAMRPAGR